MKLKSLSNDLVLASVKSPVSAASPPLEIDSNQELGVIGLKEKLLRSIADVISVDQPQPYSRCEA